MLKGMLSELIKDVERRGIYAKNCEYYRDDYKDSLKLLHKAVKYALAYHDPATACRAASLHYSVDQSWIEHVYKRKMQALQREDRAKLHRAVRIMNSKGKPYSYIAKHTGYSKGYISRLVNSPCGAP